jgi:hypothetical protein
MFKRESKTEYSLDIQAVHNEFMTSADILLKEANEIIKNTEIVNEDKINKLKTLGFTSSREVIENKDIMAKREMSKETANIIEYYKERYPIYKFITRSQVSEICKKYGLVCGDISLYNGFVPEIKLQDIVNFTNVKSDDIIKETYLLTSYKSNSLTRQYSKIFDMIIKDEFILTSISTKGFEENVHRYILEKGMSRPDGWADEFDHLETISMKGSDSFIICAPSEDMNITDSGKQGYFVGDKVKVKKQVPDPVVLKPVKHGYLIVTAWGDEASDPLVVNEKKN